MCLAKLASPKQSSQWKTLGIATFLQCWPPQSNIINDKYKELQCFWWFRLPCNTKANQKISRGSPRAPESVSRPLQATNPIYWNSQSTAERPVLVALLHNMLGPALPYTRVKAPYQAQDIVSDTLSVRDTHSGPERGGPMISTWLSEFLGF